MPVGNIVYLCAVMYDANVLGKPFRDFSLNVCGSLFSLDRPQVMGILNCTPDSFYASSRTTQEETIIQRARQIVDEGGTIIDVGACSTRPSSAPVSEAEEMERLRKALPIIVRSCPSTPLSIDTFRPDVARMCVEEYGATIINDVGQTATHAPRSEQERRTMFTMVSRLRVPYVLTSGEATMEAMLLQLERDIEALHAEGVADVIADPGFGFGKDMAQNYAILGALEQLHLLRVPLLVGVSRKSMFTRLLNISAEEALNATTAAHAIALIKGAHILRVHDVKAAAEAIAVTKMTTDNS